MWPPSHVRTGVQGLARMMMGKSHYEDGFTFVEILAVVIILGLLALIAIPQFVGQRERGWESAARASLRSAILAEQAHVADRSVFSAVEADLAEHGLTISHDVDPWINPSADVNRFQVHAQHCYGGDQFRFVSDGAATIERVVRAARSC